MNKKKNKKKSRNSSTSSSSMDSVCRTFKLLLSHTHSHKFNSLNCIDEEKKIESNSLILHMVKKNNISYLMQRKKTILHIRLRIFFPLSLCFVCYHLHHHRCRTWRSSIRIISFGWIQRSI